MPIDAAAFVEQYADDPERGDDIRARVRPLREGGALARPRLHCALAPNPVFDLYRTSGFPLAGEVVSDSIAATETFEGQEITAILPADTTGFAHFRPYSPPRGKAYASAFTMRAPPTILSAQAPLSQPPVLVVDCTTTSPELDLWQRSLAQGGYREGHDYDVFPSYGGTDDSGRALGAGLYFARFRAHGEAVGLLRAGAKGPWLPGSGGRAGIPRR